VRGFIYMMTVPCGAVLLPLLSTRRRQWKLAELRGLVLEPGGSEVTGLGASELLERARESRLAIGLLDALAGHLFPRLASAHARGVASTPRWRCTLIVVVEIFVIALVFAHELLLFTDYAERAQCIPADSESLVLANVGVVYDR